MLFSGSLTAMLSGAVIVLVTITVHELAHGYTAYLLGDNMAKNAERLSLNPLAHLDPLGAILLFVTGFGWAKPVPINPFYFKGSRSRGILLVSLAGPLSNVVLAFVLAMFVPLAARFNMSLAQIIASAIYLNIYMAIFNLLPIPPLDGSKILASLIPKDAAYKFLSVMDQYGMILLLVLAITNVFGKIISPIAGGIYTAFVTLAFTLF